MVIIMKKFALIALMLCAVLLLCSCNSVKDDTANTSSLTTEDGSPDFNIKPSDDDKIVSDTEDYKPSDNVNYEKVDVTIAPEDVEANGFDLSDKKTNMSIATVYIERGENGYISIDINTKNASDENLNSAIDMTRSIISSVYKNFPFDEFDGQIPLSLKTLKDLISGNTRSDNIIYGSDFDSSISYEFFPDTGVIIYNIEL